MLDSSVMPQDPLYFLAAAVLFLLGAFSAGHALLRKRDPRAALGWIVACLWVPLAGALAYWTFGINRIATRAKKLGNGLRSPAGKQAEEGLLPASPREAATEMGSLARLGAAVTGLPLLAGNRVEPLHNGEEAFPAMLEAIAGARRSVYFCSYLFDTDGTGERFLEAFSQARKRGVEVRVIVDGIGQLYSKPPASWLLKKRNIPHRRFLPPKLWPPSLRINLRTHRKILTVDGEVAFTGGMNLGDRHLLNLPLDGWERPGSRVVDLHFRCRGPIVKQIEEVFREDWHFVSGERLPASPEAPEAAGEALCRAIVDGPDENLDKLLLLLLGAVAEARHRLVLMTPYFLPPRELIAAVVTAAVRGVEVIVVLPEENNLPYVHWATRKMLWELLQRGIRVFYQPPPFVHTKLCLVDERYVLLGSANLDPRSLRLNFELNVEVYDRDLAGRLTAHVDDRLEASKEVTLDEMDSRSLPTRIRDGLFWLLSPYL